MNKGSITLTRCIRKIIEGMDVNQFMPSNYITVTSNSLDSTQRQSPISLGNKFSVELLSGTEISVDKEGKTYIVPVDCPSTRFRRPAGMRSTLYCNTVLQHCSDAISQCRTVSSDSKEQKTL